MGCAGGTRQRCTVRTVEGDRGPCGAAKAPSERPTGFVLLGAFHDAQDFPAAIRGNADRHQEADVPDFACPLDIVLGPMADKCSPLHDDTVEEDVRVISLEGPVTPRVNLGVDCSPILSNRWRSRAHY